MAEQKTTAQMLLESNDIDTSNMSAKEAAQKVAELTGIKNVAKNKTPRTQQEMADNFTQMMKNVEGMLQQQGPVYTTWIKFQLGKNGTPVIFNSNSTDKYQNLITSLDIQKTGANTCNSFTLKVVYDPFNNGQETKNQIEILDEYLAKAMSADLGTSDDDNIVSTDALRGYLQYGYSTSYNDTKLVSPNYEFILTDAQSKVKVSSGITNYTFEGTCAVASDCNFEAKEIGPFPSNWKFMDVIIYTLYLYYGDKDNKPIGQEADCYDNPYKYRIECSSEIYNDSPTVADLVGEGGQLEAVPKVNPIKYVESLLQQYPLLKSEIDSKDYEMLSEMNYKDRPRYDWYITDTEEGRVFNITHYNPKDGTSNSSSSSIWLYDGNGLTWGTQGVNIVTDWNPTVDTKLYLIRKAMLLRTFQKVSETGVTSVDDLENVDNEFKEIVKNAIEKDLFSEDKEILQELYDAEITLVGIPADAPINSRIKILPRILESVSRTAGTYIVKSSEDHITPSGVYSTTLKLFRVDDTEGSYETLQTLLKQTTENSTETTN